MPEVRRKDALSVLLLTGFQHFFYNNLTATDVVTDVTDDLSVGLTDQASATSATKSAARKKHDYLVSVNFVVEGTSYRLL